jgi:hypothetical protein
MTTLPPLFVDLDGTLMKSDVLSEGVVSIAKRRPETEPSEMVRHLSLLGDFKRQPLCG